MEKKRDFLINTAYWLVIIAAVYLALKYVMPVVYFRHSDCLGGGQSLPETALQP